MSLLNRNEEVLMVLTSWEKLLDEEGYNPSTLKRGRDLISAMRTEMKVQRVCGSTNKIEYKI
jgi:hypothetical protein